MALEMGTRVRQRKNWNVGAKVIHHDGRSLSLKRTQPIKLRLISFAGASLPPKIWRLYAVAVAAAWPHPIPETPAITYQTDLARFRYKLFPKSLLRLFRQTNRLQTKTFSRTD